MMAQKSSVNAVIIFRFVVFLSLSFFVLIFLSNTVFAQTPSCSGVGDTFNSYQTCAADVCTVYMCDGSSFNATMSYSVTGDLNAMNDITYVGGISDVSDQRLKDNIIALGNNGSVSEQLAKINTYSFSMKRDEQKKIEFGVMAQELEKIFPELVNTADDEFKTKSVNYVGLIAPIIESVKELKAENEALKEELKEIKEALKTQ